jgi:carbamoyltransferase
LINTSFNVRGEPMVCSAEDAYRCFMATGIDVLVLGHHVFLKEQQPEKNPLAQQEFAAAYALD